MSDPKSWLEKWALERAKQASHIHWSATNCACDYDNCPCDPCVAKAIVDIAREFAERACRNMNNVTGVKCKCDPCNATVAEAIKAAEVDE